ncbi:MAG TPA: nitroreductase family deazaflavin-dependent oxidoreductase, partial [Jatrophihabitans sp.]|nr:nitroreductase family deazaflavin-dependent oxidoreductase [Jatrophihabitans sp.]
MAPRHYVRPNWMQRHVGNRLSVLFRPSVILRLSVAGRHTGRSQTVPVVLLHHSGARYLVSVHGDSDWVRNLKAAGTATLSDRKRTESITATEVPVAQRGALLDAYVAKFGKNPSVTPTLRALPDPA